MQKVQNLFASFAADPGWTPRYIPKAKNLAFVRFIKQRCGQQAAERHYTAEYLADLHKAKMQSHLRDSKDIRIGTFIAKYFVETRKHSNDLSKRIMEIGGGTPWQKHTWSGSKH